MKRSLRLSYPFLLLLFVIGMSSVLAAPGMFDLSFGTNGVVITDFGGSDRFSALAIDSQGRMVAVGDSYNSTAFASNPLLARYTADGLLDSSFDGDGKIVTAYTGRGLDAVIQPDDKIVVAGEVDFKFGVTRFGVNGTPDTTFDTDGVAIPDLGEGTGVAQAVTLLGDGSIVAAGNAYDGVNSNLVVAKFGANGLPDTSFDTDGVVMLPVVGAYPGVGAVLVQADGKIVVGGIMGVSPGVGHLFMRRFNTDGSPDAAFGTTSNGLVELDISATHLDGITGMKLDANGKIVISGYLSSSSISIDGILVARFNTDGSFDTTFSEDGIQITSFSATGAGKGAGLVIDSDGKIIVVGTDAAFYYGGQLALVRYNPDGTLDTTFDVDGKLVTSGVYLGEEAQDIVIDSEGRYVVAGFGNGNAVLYRFESDGTPVAETLNNGGFENKAPQGALPAGWTGKSLLNDKRLCNTDTKFITENGNCAFRFIGSAKNDASLTRKLNISGLVTGDDLVLRFVAAGEGVLQGKGEVRVLVTYKNKTTAAFKIVVPVGNYRDVFQSLPLNIQRPVASVTVTLRYKGVSGKVTFDEVSVLRLPAYTPPTAALIPVPPAP